MRVSSENIGYHGHTVLIMDGFGCHIDAELAKIFDQHGVSVVLLTPHSSLPLCVNLLSANASTARGYWTDEPGLSGRTTIDCGSNVTAQARTVLPLMARRRITTLPRLTNPSSRLA